MENNSNTPVRIPLPALKPIKESPLYENMRDLISGCANEYGDDIAFIIKTKKETSSSPAEYIRKNFYDVRDDINLLGAALLKRGYKGKRLAVISKNRYEWVLTYFAQQGGLGIVVPLDKDLPYNELSSCIEKAKVDILVFDSDRLPLVEKLKEDPAFNKLIYISMDNDEGYEHISDLLEESKNELQLIEEYKNLPVDKDVLSIILFTSGTSGIAKAVMLSQYNVTHNNWATMTVEDLRRGDINMAFLPYHHTFGATGQIMMMAAGVTTVFCDGLKYVQKNMVEYKVTMFVCVPLLIEAIYKKIMAEVTKQGKLGKLNKARKVSRFLMKMGIDVRRKIFSEIIDKLGGGLRFMVSGASPLDPVVAEGFYDFGMSVVQGYGLTETSPVIASENSWFYNFRSIGGTVNGVEAMIENPDEEGIGELIARGPNVMLGYYENQEATDETIIDGWFHTGDLACISEDGKIVLRGRKKNVIVLKNGKNVYPEELEILVGNLPYVKECLVYGEVKRADGDNKDLNIAIKVVYDPEEYPNGIEEMLDRDIDKINSELPLYKQIFSKHITTEEMEKTTTGKIKRYKQTMNE